MTKTEESEADQAETTRGTPWKFEPLSFKKSIAQWWSSPNAEQCEFNILSYLPFYPESDGKREAKSTNVDIGNDLSINEFQIVNTEETVDKNEKNLVVLHGYGAGLGLFYQNFDAWSLIKGSKTYALDLLGFGRSSRPKFNIKTKDVSKKDDQGQFLAVKETEDWFVESLEKWRKARSLEKFTLMGHSMGGYIAAVYAMRYPQHVEGLILVSPAGIERGYKPSLEHKSLFNNSKKIMEHDTVELEEPVIQDHHENDDDHKDLYDEKSATKREMSHYLQYLWNSHVSPFVFLKRASIFGPMLMSQWSYRRFGDLPEEQRHAMHQYAYKIFTAPASGEYAITRLLAPGAVARMPILNRLDEIKCPSMWIYGENDWMNISAGKEACKRLERYGYSTSHHVLSKAGHHVYLDNPNEFDNLIHEFLSNDRC